MDMVRTLHRKPAFRFGAGLVLLAGCILLGCQVLSWFMRPDLANGLTRHSQEEIRALEILRNPSVDPDNPQLVHREVDYGQGESAQWFPKAQAPILDDLVRSGRLPPVAERVGAEPCVMEGVDGVGRYGGTWMRLATSATDVPPVIARLAGTNLVRWSPDGFPLVPHVAKSWTVSPDNREYTFTLRRGMKWSDGHPFTADDIMYWWAFEANDPSLRDRPPSIMIICGESGSVEKLDDYRVRFSFPHPNGLFLAQLATIAGQEITDSPAHYLKQYHPRVGEEGLIERRSRARRIKSRRTLYKEVKDELNPEHPRLWPWLYRTYRANPPQSLVRNPYYWVVDTQGNQLPYIDRVFFQQKSRKMIQIAMANGDADMQGRHVGDYTQLMINRKKSGYDVRHWIPGSAGGFVVFPNLNRRIDSARPETRLKRELLNEKRFRQALSLAINRKQIIRSTATLKREPVQASPPPTSPYYSRRLRNSFTAYDPGHANRLLDEIGLTGRDSGGYRTFRDGTRMTFHLNRAAMGGVMTEGAPQFVIDDWAKVGLRVVLREKSRSLWAHELRALKHDLSLWGAGGGFYPMIAAGTYVPVQGNGKYGMGFVKWYQRGGLYGDPSATRENGCIAPPPGHPLREAMKCYERARAEGELTKQRDEFRKVLDIAAENLWCISVYSPAPSPFIVKDGFRNVPIRAVSAWDFLTPANVGPETFFFDKARNSAGAIEQIKAAILEPTLSADLSEEAGVVSLRPTGKGLGTLLKWKFVAIGLAVILLAAFKHPYIGRRLAIMVPTLMIISFFLFFVIQLPPGNYVESKIMELEEAGEEANEQEIADLREQFHLDSPWIVRYFHWLGLEWFVTFDSKHAGLLQGNMGRSMESGRLVNDVVGDRILLTFFISLGTILFTWAVAVPIGIFSAVRQYSFLDYVFTFIGFLGMCVPSFLLALLLMVLSSECLGISVTGLFSSRYSAQPEWTWGKLADLLKHIWVPVVVLGVSGTASMIRVMRANLLDELRKPYVITAMAKGVRPMKLLFKYPVRIALNPFISGIGGIFPALVSGGAIVAMVLSLPTVGPLMLSALMSEDMYLAGSMLMVLSLLGVFGVLVSDLLLLVIDPRIRFQGGSR